MTTTIDTTPSAALIPGRTIRVAATLVTGTLFTAAVLAADITPHTILIIGMAVLAIGCGYRPDTTIPLLACMLAVVILVSGDLRLNVWLLCLPSLLHATHLLAALGAVVPASARVERQALVPSLRRFGFAQAIALPVIAVLGQFVI